MTLLLCYGYFGHNVREYHILNVNRKGYDTDMKGSLPEAVVPSCSVEKVFLEISQNSQENTCARVSFLIKLQALSGTGVIR